jgi:hypothetical protein
MADREYRKALRGNAGVAGDCLRPECKNGTSSRNHDRLTLGQTKYKGLI